MTDTPKEQEPGTDVETDCEETLVDGSLLIAGLPREILVQLAETLGNPLALLVSKAHLSKAFCEAARNAQGLLSQADLLRWVWRVDDAVVAAVVAKCTQLSLLNLHSCGRITDVAVKAVASKCKQLTTLHLAWCSNITDEAVVAVASECKQLTTLGLVCCRSITNAAVLAVASECKLLTTLDLYQCTKITDEAVMAVASGARGARSSSRSTWVQGAVPVDFTGTHVESTTPYWVAAKRSAVRSPGGGLGLGGAFSLGSSALGITTRDPGGSSELKAVRGATWPTAEGWS